MVEKQRQPICEIDLDRLVDGELSADQQRDLLKRLDGQSDGWKQCALAFLEAQAWRRHLAHWPAEKLARSEVRVRNLESEGTRAHTSQSNYPRSRADSIDHQWLSLAAAILIAFGVGLFSQQWLTAPGESNRGRQLAKPGQPSESQGPRYATMGSPASPAVGNAPAIWNLVELGEGEEVIPVVFRDQNGHHRRHWIPLVEHEGLQNQLQQVAGGRFNSVLPSGVREQFEKAGYQVSARRRFAPLPIHGGRKVYVPIDDTEIRAIP